MATSTLICIELKFGSELWASPICRQAGRIHANKFEMIIEGEFLNKWCICPSQYPSVVPILLVKRKDYFLNLSITLNVNTHTRTYTENPSPGIVSLTDYAESKCDSKNAPHENPDCLYRPCKTTCSQQQYWLPPDHLQSLSKWEGTSRAAAKFHALTLRSTRGCTTPAHAPSTWPKCKCMQSLF